MAVGRHHPLGDHVRAVAETGGTSADRTTAVGPFEDGVVDSSVIRASQAEVWRLCRHLGDREWADDLTQETYLRAISSIARFRGDSSARTWLLTVARRTVADRVRSVHRSRRRLDSPGEPCPDPAAIVTTESLLAGLDADQRTALVLTQILGLSYAEAGEVCRVPVGTIRSRVSRARSSLIEGLSQAADG